MVIRDKSERSRGKCGMTEEPKERLAVDGVPGYEPEIGRMVWMLEDTRQLTKAGLVGLADDQLDWTPASAANSESNSIGALLYHIAAIEADWLYVEVLEAKVFPPELTNLFPDDIRDDEGHLAVAHGGGLEAHLLRLDAVRDRLLAAFRGMSLTEFRRERNLPHYTVTPEWVLHHLIQHEVEHRGEIGMLRILMAAQRETTGA
jgi:uncharacterized damage-inducible protein DinB